MVAYIEMYRNADDKIAAGWTEAQMLRELQYHNRAYDLLTSLPQIGPIPGLVEQASIVDFEEKQDAVTYLKRIVGNVMFW